MWSRVKVSTAPTAPPISLAAMKARIRVTSGDEDTVIMNYINGATARIDGPSGIGYAMMTQAWELSLDCFPSVICPPGAPVSAVNSIKYYDVDNALQTLDAAEYRVDVGGDRARVEPVNGWPSTKDRFGAVVINYQLGVSDDADVPADLVDAVALLVAHRYENREAVSLVAMPQLPLGYMSIVAEYSQLSSA